MTRQSKISNKFSKKTDGLSNNKIRQTLKEDLHKAIEAHNALARITQNNVEEISDRLADISIIQQALAQLVGIEKVNEAAKAIRIKLLEEEVARQSESVAKGVEEKKLLKTDTITEDSLVVTSVTKTNGEPMHPSKNYLPFGYYKPEVKALLKDKKVGDKIELPTGGSTIEVLEVYIEVKPQS
jgi:hypothetical protein